MTEVMAEVTLFQFEECPYCAKVRAKLRELGISYRKMNVPSDRQDPLRQELLEKSGVPTVPVLKVDGKSGEKYIGGSADIIAFLEKEFGK